MTPEREAAERAYGVKYAPRGIRAGVLSSETPPRFCSVDGQPLVDRVSQLSQRYDVISGVAESPRNVVAKECPHKSHDVWILNQQSGDWVKP